MESRSDTEESGHPLTVAEGRGVPERAETRYRETSDSKGSFSTRDVADVVVHVVLQKNRRHKHWGKREEE